MINIYTAIHNHPPHRYPAKFGCVLPYSPYLFGKKLFSMQGKLVNNKQAHFLKQNFSALIRPIDKRCLLFCCWLIFELILLFVDQYCFFMSTFVFDYSDKAYIWSRFGKVWHEKMTRKVLGSYLTMLTIKKYTKLSHYFFSLYHILQWTI